MNPYIHLYMNAYLYIRKCMHTIVYVNMYMCTHACVYVGYMLACKRVCMYL